MPQERTTYTEQMIARARDRSRRARDELAVAALDLSLPRQERLTDRQRAIAGDILAKLVAGTELEIRQYLVEALLRARIHQPELEAKLGDESSRIVQPEVEALGLYQNTSLLEVVMRRMREHLIADAATEGAVMKPIGGDLVEALARNPDAELARRAVAYIVAQAKRRDTFQEPVLSRDELPGDVAYRLYWRVAVVLRQHILRAFVIEQTELDRAVEDAVRRSLADHLEGQGVTLRSMRLATRLNDLGELTDEFIARALAQGHAALFAAALSVRAGIDLDAVWRILADNGRDSLLVLACAIGMESDAIGSILDLLDRSSPTSRPPGAVKAMISAYADIGQASAQRVLRSWQLDPGYRSAIDELGGEAA